MISMILKGVWLKDLVEGNSTPPVIVTWFIKTCLSIKIRTDIWTMYMVWYNAHCR